jgi:hypothetical protein
MVNIWRIGGTSARWHGGRADHCWLHMDVTGACNASENGFEMVDPGFELIVFRSCDIFVTAGTPSMRT